VGRQMITKLGLLENKKSRRSFQAVDSGDVIENTSFTQEVRIRTVRSELQGPPEVGPADSRAAGVYGKRPDSSGLAEKQGS